ncbi:MAG TPA: substrate-binding domain-containing protein [Acetobacteraceae bacterium]|jgi:ABC-type molybdate transport system substrate-binding protein|nr:substrate-binding domain-containing protein [Acetobacteraceae bacterium]
MQVDRRTLLAGLPAAAMVLAAPRIARAAFSPAPDISAFVEPTLVPVIGALGRTFLARTGAPLHIFAAPSKMLIREIPFTLADVAVLQTDALLAADLAGNVVGPGRPVPIGLNGLVVARRGEGPAVPIEQLTVTGTLAVVDEPVPDSLGVASHDAMRRADWPPPETKIQGVARDADALFLLKTRAAALAILYRTDVAADPSLSTAAVLPSPQIPLTYAAAISAKPSSRFAADFVEFLGSPGSIAQLRSAGLEPS